MRTVTLPDVDKLPKIRSFDLSQANCDYLRLLEDMGLSNISKEEITELQKLIANVLEELADKYCDAAISDYHGGKIERIEDAPMYRNPDGKIIVNELPDDSTKWIFFVAWLNMQLISIE